MRLDIGAIGIGIVEYGKSLCLGGWNRAGYWGYWHRDWKNWRIPMPGRLEWGWILGLLA